MRWFALVLGLGGASALAQIPVNLDSLGALSVEKCVYGRGEAVVAMARNEGLSQLAQFLEGPVLRQTQSSTSDLKTSDGSSLDSSATSVLEQQAEYVASGQDIQNLAFKTSQPTLMGGETCVTVTLQPEPPSAQPVSADGSSTGKVTVVVSGEGRRTEEQSARARAELDAQRRAISQVVGVWLTEQSAQSSTLSMAIDDDSESTQMSDLMTHQLTARSDGYISSWSTLSVTDLSDGGVRVEIEALVERDQVVEQSQSLLADLGSPRVAISASSALEPYLRDWLNDNGISVDPNASLQLVADSKLRPSGNSGKNRRLSMQVSVKDQFGNVYGRWKNNPTLIALPDSDFVFQDLVEVHLATDSQMKDFSDALQSAFLDIFRRGGTIRELSIPADSVSSSAEVRRILSMSAGISDIKLTQSQGTMQVEMRYPGPTQDLAIALTQQLRHIAANQKSSVSIISDTQLRFQ